MQQPVDFSRFFDY